MLLLTLFSKLKISDVMIPQNIIVPVSKKQASAISGAFGTEKEVLFFIVVVSKDGKYRIVDRYDVYVAAKSINSESIHAFVLSECDDVTAQLTLSMKHFPNPATIIRMITPYVKKHGIKKTLDMFYLDSGFGKMYDISLDPKTLEQLESLIQHAYSIGVRSTVPVQLFEEINKYSSRKNQKKLIDNLYTLVETQKSKFRWPHREFLKALSSGASKKPVQRKERKASTDVREFNCTNCNETYIVTPTHIGLKNETDGIILISGEDKSKPIFSIPPNYLKQLDISMESPPTILSSKDLDFESLQKKLAGKNFIVFVGSDIS